MKYTSYVIVMAFLVALSASSLSAQLIIEDFESYIDTSSLQADVFSFGSAAQAGKPSLAIGLGENDTNAACFNLTWETGNNANVSFINLSPNTQNLNSYSEVTAFIFIEDYPSGPELPGAAAAATSATIVKLAIEGADGSIWQTRSVKASRPTVNASDTLRFRLSPLDMERVEGQGQFPGTLSNIKNIRLRFENSRRSGFRQDAYIDSITAVQ